MKKGFAGESLELAVETITSDKTRWVDTMLQEEHGLSLDRPNPVSAAIVTFVAFIIVGVLPLLAFVIDYIAQPEHASPFFWSTCLTGLAFFAVGAVKSRFVSVRWYWSGLETLTVGGVAAALAYAVGMLLRGVA